MTTITMTEFQKDPIAIFLKIDSLKEPIRITREGLEPLIISLEDEGWKETIYLLRNSKNAKRLQEAEEDYQAGKRNYRKRNLIDSDDDE